MVVDPERDSRRGNALRILGMVLTIGGALLMIGGIVGILANAVSPYAFDYFWMPFVGGFALAGGIFAWVGGNLLRGSARFAQSAAGQTHMVTAPPVAAVSGWSCPKCGNQNQVGDAVCLVCGTDRP